MKADEQKDPTNKRPMKTCDSRTHQCKSLSHDQAIEFCEELFNLYVEAKIVRSAANDHLPEKDIESYKQRVTNQIEPVLSD